MVADFREVTHGTYIVAVSGGVDSVVLLHQLTNYSEDKSAQLVVAHFDHGIRADSAKDAALVKKLASHYGLLFELGEANLGPNASEATARAARYLYLRKIKDKHKAKAIITAHHEDDLLETMLINLLRGTSWRGLSPMQNSSDILRPFLNDKKAEIINYAKSNELTWNEDSSNEDTRYLRNYVRAVLTPKLGVDRGKLVEINNNLTKIIPEINQEIAKIHEWLFEKESLDRNKFTLLSHNVAEAILQDWFIKKDIDNINKKMITNAVVFVKNANINKKFSLSKTKQLKVDSKQFVTMVG